MDDSQRIEELMGKAIGNQTWLADKSSSIAFRIANYIDGDLSVAIFGYLRVMVQAIENEVDIKMMALGSRN